LGRHGFRITELEGHDIFLGYDWLQHHNPGDQLKTGAIRFSRCPKICDGLEMVPSKYISMDNKISKHLSRKKGIGRRLYRSLSCIPGSI